MNKFLLSLALIFSGTPALATGTFEEHNRLWNVLQMNGVKTIINHHDCNNDVDGWYDWSRRELVVCQDNGRPNGPEVAWTANDLDTLRHEAHHVVQDCLLGSPFDRYSTLLFDGKQEFSDFVQNRLSEGQIKFIITSYSKDGASQKVILQELEAFATAAHVSPTVIANSVNNLCNN